MLYYKIYYFPIISYFFGFVLSQSLQNSQTLGQFFDPLYMCWSIAQDWAHEATKNQVQLTKQMVPEEYQRHIKVFLEKESLHFPPKRKEDITIPLKADVPDVINCKVYLLTREERGLLENFLAKELKLGRIKEGPSLYTSPIYFINKKNLEEKHIIMNYCEVNKWTVRDDNPLPNIREPLKNLRNKTLFSKFNIRWGYNNIRIAKKNQYKAAFKTKDGTFIPQVMYFGLMNVLPFFQRMMHWDFRELLQRYLENLGNYMDNWWIATKNAPKETAFHCRIAHEFLDQMEKKSYFFKVSKTKFEEPQMEILGWQVGAGGICIDPSKIAGIKEWPWQLKDVKQVRSTLGILGYQRPFIKNFAAIARPLHNLTKKDVPFEWTQEYTNALKQLIQAVTSEPVLYQPDFTKQFKLEVNTSLFAVGAVLFQRDEEGRRWPILYFLQALNPAERNYNIWDQEFLAMIRGLKHKRHLFVGSPQKVIILTDHKNLAHYRHPQKINKRVARYLHTLADFDLELWHIPGSTNKVDALLQRPDHDDRSQDNEEVVALPDLLFARALSIRVEEKRIREQQQANKGLFEEWKKVHQCEEEDSALFWKGALVVTGRKENYQSLLRRYHNRTMAGHPGVWKTWQAL